MKPILVVNAGSSSLKFAVYTDRELAKQIIGKIGTTGPKDHAHAVHLMLERLKKLNITPEDVVGVGHRVVHGGPKLFRPTKVTGTSLDTVHDYSYLAPLHNPKNLEAIKVCLRYFRCPHVMIFDTGFFHELPLVAQVYGLPFKFYKKYHIRRYGFHGISHAYITKQTHTLLKKKGNIITCHLGNGSSMAAIKKGKPIDVSMGFTPLEGLLMGTRVGDLDPQIPLFLQKELDMTRAEVEHFLNHECGLLGVSGKTRYMGDLVRNKDARSKLAVELFCYRITKYIGAFSAILGTVDAIVFTAGIGENVYQVRRKVLHPFKNIKLDGRKNANNALVIAKGKPKVFVIPTNEEFMIAEEVKKLL